MGKSSLPGGNKGQFSVGYILFGWTTSIIRGRVIKFAWVLQAGVREGFIEKEAVLVSRLWA